MNKQSAIIEAQTLANKYHRTFYVILVSFGDDEFCVSDINPMTTRLHLKIHPWNQTPNISTAQIIERLRQKDAAKARANKDIDSYGKKKIVILFTKDCDSSLTVSEIEMLYSQDDVGDLEHILQDKYHDAYAVYEIKEISRNLDSIR